MVRWVNSVLASFMIYMTLTDIKIEARGDTQSVMECSSCIGLSGSACYAALDGAIAGLEEKSRLGLLEHVFAGDMCDDLADDPCLEKLNSIYTSLSNEQRFSTLDNICSNNLIVDYSFTEGRSQQSSCKMCEGIEEGACLSSIDSMLASLDTDSVLSVLRGLFDSKTAAMRCTGMDDEQCTGALRESLASISDSSRLVVYTTACAQDQLRFQHMAPDEETETDETGSCSVCQGLSSGMCIETLNAAIRGFSQYERLAMLEEMYAGDSCEDKSNSECLQHLDQMFSSESDDKKMSQLLSVCNTATLLEAVNEIEIESTLMSDAVRHRCPGCQGSSDSECLEKLTTSVASMTDTDRLSLEKSFLSSKYKCSTSLSDELCLEYYDQQFARLTMNEQLTYLDDACGDGILTLVQVEEAQPDDKCMLCDGLSVSECLVKLNRNFDALMDNDQLQLLKNGLGSDWKRLCSWQTDTWQSDKECLTTLREHFSTLNDTEQFITLETACVSAGTFSHESGDEDQETDIEDDVSSEVRCNYCENLSSEECLASLDSTVMSMTDRNKLRFLKEAVLDWQPHCAGQTDKECLTTLVNHVGSLDDVSRLSTLQLGCELLSSYMDGGTAVTGTSELQTPVVDARIQDCVACQGLDSDECMQVLETELDGMQDKTKLRFLKDAVSEWKDICSDLTDFDCLNALTKYVGKVDSTTKLAILQQGCMALYVDPVTGKAEILRVSSTQGGEVTKTTSLEAGQDITPDGVKSSFSMSMQAVSAIAGLVAVIFAVVRHYPTRKAGYDQLLVEDDVTEFRL